MYSLYRLILLLMPICAWGASYNIGVTDLWFSGDSVCAGAAASGQNDAYPRLTSAMVGTATHNLAISGSVITSYAKQLLPGGVHPSAGTSDFTNAPSALTASDALVIEGDYCGLRDHGLEANYATHLERTLRAIALYGGVPSTYLQFGTAASVGKSGSWSASSQYGGAMGVSSSTVNDSVAFYANGRSVYVCMLTYATSGLPGSSGSNVEITIDGVSCGIYSTWKAYGNRPAYGSTSGEAAAINYAPWCYRFAGLSDTRHLISVSVTGGDATKPACFLFGYGSGDYAPSYAGAPLVVIMGTQRPLLAGGVSLTSESDIDTAMATFHRKQLQIAQELGADGLRAVYADPTGLYDPATASGDNVHPNNSGHAQLATAILNAALRPPPAVANAPGALGSVVISSLPSGTDRQMVISGNTINVTLASDPSSAQNLGLCLNGGSVILGSTSRVYFGSGSTSISSGDGSPEGVVSATVGSVYLRRNGGTNTTLYVKQSGSGTTGWAAK